MKKLVALILVVFICVSFTACGEKSKIIGTWHTYDLGVGIDSPEIPPYYSIVFAPDGTGRGPMAGLDRLDTVVFDYTIEDDIIKVVTDYGDKIDIRYWFEGDNLLLEWNNYTRTLHKYSDDVIIEWH
ncbi:MAG: hypothetical protein E7563_02010 [Ruminococcaceae bacterium]|nr:hypothetical protein [Oscillospiraceae bacterium]